MKSRTTSWMMFSLLALVAALTTGCGRLRPNGTGAPAAATFTAAAPVQAVEPTATPLAVATSAPTAGATVASAATAPTASAPTASAPAASAPAPTATVVQNDTSGDALDDLLGGLLNGVADDPTFQSELDQIP